MIPTVQRQLRKRSVTTTDLTPWVNEELLPVLNQVRQGLNYVCRQQAQITTDGTATFTTIWASEDLALNSACRFDADVVGYEGANVSTFTIIAIVLNDGVVLIDTTATPVNMNSGGFAVQYTVVGNHIELQVKDAGDPVAFTAVVDALVQNGP